MACLVLLVRVEICNLEFPSIQHSITPLLLRSEPGAPCREQIIPGSPEPGFLTHLSTIAVAKIIGQHATPNEGKHPGPRLALAVGSDMKRGIALGSNTNAGQTAGPVFNKRRAFGPAGHFFDDLHIVWDGRFVDDAGYWSASKIFHWDEVNQQISVVNSPSTYYSDPGGWWISTTSRPLGQINFLY